MYVRTIDESAVIGVCTSISPSAGLRRDPGHDLPLKQEYKVVDQSQRGHDLAVCPCYTAVAGEVPALCCSIQGRRRQVRF